jgi:glycosyltransferase involved in cell wall biosynthesis
LIRDTPGLEHLGYVSAEKLQELMRSAKWLVFPSLHEGFGMPVIEALRVGTPVACSNTTSLLEVGGEAAEVRRQGGWVAGGAGCYECRQWVRQGNVAAEDDGGGVTVVGKVGGW